MRRKNEMKNIKLSRIFYFRTQWVFNLHLNFIFLTKKKIKVIMFIISMNNLFDKLYKFLNLINRKVNPFFRGKEK